MKLYSHTTRGIPVAGNALSQYKVPMILTESLLKAPNATFVDRLVFADAVVEDDKIFLHAQASESDERALVFYSHREGCSWDAEENVSYDVSVNRAEVLHVKRENEYGYFGMYSDVQDMVLVIEPGGHTCLQVKRIFEYKAGFWAGLFGAKDKYEEVFRHIEVGYDGTEITVRTVLEQRREITRLNPVTPVARPLLA